MSAVVDSYRFAMVGGGITDPTDIAGLLAWYDASDTATITSSAGAVSQWDDKSGNALHVSQSGSAKPTTGAATKNGLNVLSLNGTNGWLTHDAGSDVLDLAPFSFFIVAMHGTALSPYDRIVSFRRSATGSNDFQSPNAIFCARQAANALSSNSGNGAVATTVGYTIGTYFSYSGRCDGTNIYHSIDGGTEYSSAAPSPDPMRYLRVGTSCTSVSNPPGTGADIWNGQIAEIVIYTADLGTTDRTAVEDYLATKWGL